jgi:hypothetical protein
VFAGASEWRCKAGIGAKESKAGEGEGPRSRLYPNEDGLGND